MRAFISAFRTPLHQHSMLSSTRYALINELSMTKCVPNVLKKAMFFLSVWHEVGKMGWFIRQPGPVEKETYMTGREHHRE